MQQLFLLFVLTFSLYGESTIMQPELRIYQTTDKNLSLKEIKKRSHLFIKIKKDERLEDKDRRYWLQLKTNGLVDKGEYFINYGDMDFNISSFSHVQKPHKFMQGEDKIFRFFYDKVRDPDTYYFGLIPLEEPCSNIYLSLQKSDEFHIWTTGYLYYLLISGMMLGLILMTSFYNAILFYYKREKSFLYYALMQLFMVSLLLYLTGLLEHSSKSDEVWFDMLGLIIMVFATLFTSSFFNTAKYLKKWDIVLKTLLFLIASDMLSLILTQTSLIYKFNLYSLFGLVYIVIGYLRYKEGFKPAKFFLMGWSVLFFSVFLSENTSNYDDIDFLLIGSTIEAILLAIGLAYSIRLTDEEKESQKEILVHQSKLASMGEMIGNIAHQWRQPLTYLSYNFMTLKEAEKQNVLESKYLHKKLDEATVQLEFMSQTIDDFKDFYAPKKEKELFTFYKATNEVLELMKQMFQQHKIEIVLEVREEKEIKNYKNEYKQVVLNLLSNAKDALVQKEIENPKIVILIDSKSISISDNAGGIDRKIINRIFEPYFSTKEGSSGIGLYMSKMIVEKNMGGTLRVENSLKGAVFRLEF